MSESPDSRISIRLKETRRTDAVGVPDRNTSVEHKSPRRWQSVIIAIALSAVAWGTWSFFNSSSSPADSDSITDLDGFESAPSFVTSTSDNTESKGLGASVPLLDAPGPIDIHSVFDDSRYMEKSSVPADVWLTGTIEDIEPSDRIEIPRRISRGGSEPAVVR